MAPADVNRKSMRIYSVLLVCLVLATIIIGCSNPETKKARHLEKGESYLKEGKLKEAIIEFKNVIQIDPRDVQGHYKLAQIYLRQGGSLNVQAGFKELVKT